MDIAKGLMFWMHNDYAARKYPLAFQRLPELSRDQKIELLTWFDRKYGDTNQEVTMWALEYQLLARMLLCEDALLVNPKFLDTMEVMDELLAILTPNQRECYGAALCLKTDDIWAAYVESPDCCGEDSKEDA